MNRSLVIAILFFVLGCNTQLPRDFSNHLHHGYGKIEVFKPTQTFYNFLSGYLDDFDVDTMNVSIDGFSPKGNWQWGDTSLARFDYAFLKFRLTTKDTLSAHTVAFVLDSNYKVTDDYIVPLYHTVDGNQIFISDIYINSLKNAFKVELYSPTEQTPKMHPHLTKVDSSYVIPLDTISLKLVKPKPESHWK